MLTPEDTAVESRTQARRRWLLLAVAVLTLGAAAWLTFMRPPAIPQRATSRSTTDFVVTWRCLECDHTERGHAGTGPRSCPACGVDALFSSIRYGCGEHGVYNVAFQYDDRGKPTEVNVDDAGWRPAADDDGNWNTVCPVCERWMYPAETLDTEP